MDKNFAEALDDLINDYIDGGGIDEIVSALELKLMALKEEAQMAEDNRR